MQQPLQEQSDAKCQRTKIQMQFREPTCKKCTMQSSESWLKCIKSVILYPDSLLLPPSPKLHFFKAEISFSSTAGLHHLMQCSAVLCRLFFSLPTTWNCVYSQPFQDILSFYISPLAPDGIKLQVWLKAAFVYPIVFVYIIRAAQGESRGTNWKHFRPGNSALASVPFHSFSLAIFQNRCSKIRMQSTTEICTAAC